MTREEWSRAEPVLTQALLLPAHERKALIDTAFLEEALRRELLDALERTSQVVAPAAGSGSGVSVAVPPPRVITLQPGDALDSGRFVVVRQIGRGGMGSVYLAHDTMLGTLVALKALPFDERLITEARRAAVCSGHPHVATVHNVLRTDIEGEPVGLLVMEYVAGTPASRLLDDGPVEVAQALRWGRQVAAAVAHAHDHQVLHCDLKPANIVITPDGRAKVLDFGIARATFDPVNASEPVRGTIPYMAPEQLLAGEFSQAGDIYSLGVTLFEMISGRRPFEGPDAKLRMQILMAPPPPLQELIGGVPPQLETILERAMAKDPDRRYRSARALERALEDVETGVRRTTTVSVPLVAGVAPTERKVGALAASVAAAIAGFVALSLVLGFIASRAFEVILGIGSEFESTPADYFRIGSRALLPFLFYWIVAAAGLALLVGARSLVRWALKERWAVSTPSVQPLDPTVVRIAVLLCAVAAWVTLTWMHAGIFAALHDLWQDPQSADVRLISATSRPDHLQYATYSAFLSFILIVAAVRWLPRLKPYESSPASPFVVCAVLLVAFLTIAGPTVPRRFLFERFRALEYQGRSVLVLASGPDEMLLYDRLRRETLRASREVAAAATDERSELLFQD